jgi:hypothetical protein
MQLISGCSLPHFRADFKIDPSQPTNQSRARVCLTAYREKVKKISAKASDRNFERGNTLGPVLVPRGIKFGISTDAGWKVALPRIISGDTNSSAGNSIGPRNISDLLRYKVWATVYITSFFNFSFTLPFADYVA